MKKLILKIPVIGSIISKWKRSLNSLFFPGSEEYWNRRYDQGGNSGPGSYNHLAEFKAGIINDFVKRNNIQSVIEYGCGDGNQLKLSNYPLYIGFDVSSKAISTCKQLFVADKTKQFKSLNEYNGERADLTSSLDVIYHLTEDRIFEAHLNLLFGSSDRYVIIYSSNDESLNQTASPHVRHRHFTSWVAENFPDWIPEKQISNQYRFDGDQETSSFADFHIFKKAEV